MIFEEPAQISELKSHPDDYQKASNAKTQLKSNLEIKSVQYFALLKGSDKTSWM